MLCKPQDLMRILFVMSRCTAHVIYMWILKLGQSPKIITHSCVSFRTCQDDDTIVEKTMTYVKKISELLFVTQRLHEKYFVIF